MNRKQSALVSCKSSEHYTPASHIELVHRVFKGPPDLDPGSCTKANRIVQAMTIYTARHKLGGYARPWFGLVYCNPPGDPSGKLIRKYWRAAIAHAFSGGVVLWAGFSISHMQGLGTVDLPCPNYWTYVVVKHGPSTTGSGRTKWIDGATMTEGKAPQHGGFYCLLGGDKAMRDRFRREFAVFGRVITPSRFPTKPRLLRELALKRFGVCSPKTGITKTKLGKVLSCRHDSACKLVNELVSDGLVERRRRAYFLVES